MLPAFSFDQFLSVLQSYPYYSVVHYIKSFLKEFNKKDWTVNDKMKIIGDFKLFIMPKMLEVHSKNKVISDPELFFTEGLDKLICTKLFDRLYIPDGVDDKYLDEIFYKKCMLFKWVNLAALMDESIYKDMQNCLAKLDQSDPPEFITKHSLISKYLGLAETELIKINNYKAPRDKLVCILNSIYLLTHLTNKIKAPSHPDYLLPIIIYIIIQSRIKNMISNVQYITRFRDLKGESDYYMVMVHSAIQYIDTMDDKQLNISKEEFDTKLNRSLSEIEQELNPAMTPLESISMAAKLPPQPAKLKGLSLFLGKVVDNVFSGVPQTENLKNDIDDDSQELTGSPFTPTNQRSPAKNFPSPTKPDYLSQLTPQEQDLMEEDDLQLAMAISLSLKSGNESIHQELPELLPSFPEYELIGNFDDLKGNYESIIDKQGNNYSITLKNK